MARSSDSLEASVTPRQVDPRLIDAWSRRNLQERYAPVLDEALPETWIALIQAAER